MKNYYTEGYLVTFRYNLKFIVYGSYLYEVIVSGCNGSAYKCGRPAIVTAWI